MHIYLPLLRSPPQDVGPGRHKQHSLTSSTLTDTHNATPSVHMGWYRSHVEVITTSSEAASRPPYSAIDDTTQSHLGS